MTFTLHGGMPCDGETYLGEFFLGGGGAKNHEILSLTLNSSTSKSKVLARRLNPPPLEIPSLREAIENEC